METHISHHVETPPAAFAPRRRICAVCPRWQVPPGRLARRCYLDGAITIADHHCHLEARQGAAGGGGHRSRVAGPRSRAPTPE